jgi:hypothetical protein
VLAVLTVSVAALTTACSGSGNGQTNLVTTNTTSAAATRSTTGGAPSASATASSSMSQSPDATIGFQFSTGDHVELTFRIDKPTDMAAADVMAQSCRLNSDDSRALVQHVVVSTTLSASLAQKFTLRLGKPMAVPLAAQFAGGGQCLYPGYNSGLSLTLNPGQSNRQDLWMLGDGAAKTPSDTAGDPTILRQMMFDPSMHVGWTDMVQPDADIDYAFGSLVLACRFDTVHTIHAEIFSTAAALAKGDTYCAPSASRAAFAALVARAAKERNGG